MTVDTRSAAPGPTTVLYPLRNRLVEVRRVTRLTPGMVRVTLGGEEMAGFQDGQAGSPDDHVKLCFPAPGADRPVLPVVHADGLGEQDPKGPFPILRDYTVRAWRPERLEIDVDMVLHGHGIATTWARDATPGKVIGVLGPRGSVHYTGDYPWYLLGADETGLPALARRLAELPAGIPAFAFVQVGGPAEEQDLASAADVTLTWLHHGPAPAGADSPLEAAVRALTLPPGEGLAWFAGEATMLRPIRRYLRRELGFPKERVDVDGYWKRGVVNLDHHEDDGED